MLYSEEHSEFMSITDLIQENLILSEMRAATAAAALKEFSEFLAKRHEGVRADELLTALSKREQQGSTALGSGLAIPHGKLASIGRLIGCLGRSRKGLGFGSADGKPTHFFMVLIAPANSPGEHLKALARISRIFQSEDLRERLLEAKTAGDMLSVLAAEDAK